MTYLYKLIYRIRHTRKNRLSNIRWETGSSALPNYIRSNLNSNEQVFYSEYCDNLSNYLINVGIDITAVLYCYLIE